MLVPPDVTVQPLGIVMLKSAVSYFSVCAALATVCVTFTPLSVCSVFVPSSFKTVLLPQAARSKVMTKASASAVIRFAFIVFLSFSLFLIIVPIETAGIVFLIRTVSVCKHLGNGENRIVLGDHMACADVADITVKSSEQFKLS